VAFPDTKEQEILTLAPDEISRFLARTRRDREQAEIALDAHLREVLARANDFVPSDSGALLLDDPRPKLAGRPGGRLTVIACFGPEAPRELGLRVPPSEGLAGQIYRRGVPLEGPGAVGVPVIVGQSICGVLVLRRQAPYSARDLELLRIFAAYISSSLQNALDAIRARELARVDYLTGLYNDRFFHRRLREETERAEQDATALSLLFLDIDEFKRVNDTYGHLAGSRALREIGRVIEEWLPTGAIAARYGGDEFVIILPGADAARARAFGEELRQRIHQTALRTGDDTPAEVRVTCSIGAASYHEHVGPFGPPQRRQEVLLQLADKAMYEAKAAGKDRVILAAPED
jgi:diguanylate cyclase (GGDEF)-like protein